MRVAVTGANGFIGRNLTLRLRELSFDIVKVARDLDVPELADRLDGVAIVFHLAGVNRPEDDEEFVSGNVGMTERLLAALARSDRKVPVVYASSVQAENDTPYGRSKRAAERAIEDHAAAAGAPAHVLRLPNIFGKWCRPDYNSVVATFCNNIAHDLPIRIDDPSRELRLLYIDDLVDLLISIARDPAAQVQIAPVHAITLGDLAAQLQGFRQSRETLLTDRVGAGLTRALHATYLSYLDPKDFAYPLQAHVDARGMFVEMLRTPDCGQFSFFTAEPGITRGGHYHHSKTEKFLIVRGKARFGFRNVLTGRTCEIFTSGDTPQVVETVPGWAHDVTNIGDETMVAMLWANELFDRDRPDTIAAPVLDKQETAETRG